MNTGLLLIRLVVGLLMAAHGTQKLFGWLGGHGLAGTAGFFDALGFRPGRFFATAAALSEVSSGVLVALGLAATPSPSQAQGWWGYLNGHERAWREHQWREWGWRHHQWREHHHWRPYY